MGAEVRNAVLADIRSLEQDIAVMAGSLLKIQEKMETLTAKIVQSDLQKALDNEPEPAAEPLRRHTRRRPS